MKLQPLAFLLFKILLFSRIQSSSAFVAHIHVDKLRMQHIAKFVHLQTDPIQSIVGVDKLLILVENVLPQPFLVPVVGFTEITLKDSKLILRVEQHYGSLDSL
jgi:hypothetical protein